ncbi:MAG: sel1 repeat family protein [Aliidiomarina sp.]|uniref:tetratricopeptide repeat protein n=1 Tax=Aliidiomarina sp. TaxID=1872439 RepID=UPI0025C3849F|nr:tetratricopeptide repeat protein [Aliidiomarina sp.]MCH8501638.1 sel1 repeat family protein [Aliidiomarina sp.]
MPAFTRLFLLLLLCAAFSTSANDDFTALADKLAREQPPQAIASHVANCNSGNAVSCRQVGMYYNQAKAPADYPLRIAYYFQRGCQGFSLDPAACVYLAEIYERGLGVTANAEKAFQAVSSLCNLMQDPRGCAMFGRYLQDGVGTPVNLTQALRHLRTGCDGNLPEACFRAAVILESGDAGEVNRDLAAHYFGASCIRGVELGCRRFQRLGFSDAELPSFYTTALAQLNATASRYVVNLVGEVPAPTIDPADLTVHKSNDIFAPSPTCSEPVMRAQALQINADDKSEQRVKLTLTRGGGFHGLPFMLVRTELSNGQAHWHCLSAEGAEISSHNGMLVYLGTNGRGGSITLNASR